MAAQKELFGKSREGRDLFLYTLSNSGSMKVRVTNLGATLVSILFQDKNEKMQDVILGYDTPEEDTTPRRDLHEMIARLDEPDRTIVTLHLEGYDYKEIGQRLGMSKNNIGVRLMRAKERLRKEWER